MHVRAHARNAKSALILCSCVFTTLIVSSLQTFSIPGSIFLSFLAGALFGVPVGVLFVCAVSYIVCLH